jgi:iron complex transport system substrate-binding protein
MRSLLLVWLLFASAAGAADYPRTVVDLAGRSVILAKAPQRIVLQDSNDLLTLALLERDDPLRAIVAWDNNLASSDPGLWRLVAQRWPQARTVREIEFAESGQLDIESLLRTRPDLIVARLGAKAMIEGTVLESVLQRLGIPLIYVDNEIDPLINVARSVELLGRVLGRETEALAYLDAYHASLAHLRERIEGLPSPKVFIEARAGQAGGGACCHTQGPSGWGLLVENMGAVNQGSHYVRGDSSDVALESLILSKPDVYLMTGTQRVRRGVSAIPFGYGADAGQVRDAMALLLARPGFASIAQSPDSCVVGLNHQFYNSVFNVAGAYYLAKAFWPQAFADLDPDAEYRRMIATFTTLPDRPFVFFQRLCFAEVAL